MALRSRRLRVMTTTVRQIVRSGLQRRRQARERRRFDAMQAVACASGRLIENVTVRTLSDVFHSDSIERRWGAVRDELANLAITDKAGGVNPGDRRALYYLVSHFKPRSVLEIGTHIGASTMHMAAGLRDAWKDDADASYGISTVDALDVNDPDLTPWVQNGSTFSPAEMAARLRVDTHISFVVSASHDYFAACDEEYDFIFLDGDHSPSTIYREIPAALEVLRPEGLVVLHDYFPALQPLWSDRTVIEGPWLATERLRLEGARFKVIPLGRLPWPTKLRSQTTSLAVLVGD
jgi:predicted O-methyltransferase YrrM